MAQIGGTETGYMASRRAVRCGEDKSTQQAEI